MPKIHWLVNRLKAMSIPEVAWRLSQKKISRQESAVFKMRRSSVIEKVFNASLEGMKPDAGRLVLNFENQEYSCNTAVHLLSGFDYEARKKDWNAGFQTENHWPDTFSYDLEYKQNDSVGDARTNWELNRHFQFALLAKDYAASGEDKYLKELTDLFLDWNEKNPFLHGIAWTSVMESAVRCINWIYAYAFLEYGNASDELLARFVTGIVNMTDYIAKHYSRYSSANNHLIVEACAIGHSGILFNYQHWINLAVEILTRELPLQNYKDGVNRELSLHYQSFYMEAMGLMMRLLTKNEMNIPIDWPVMLDKMCCYVADCMGDYGEIIAFGDDDEGKILDLTGISDKNEQYHSVDHYYYVLGLLSILLERQYIDLTALECETLRWLFTDKEMQASKKKDKYMSPQYCCYREGGNTILRSKDHRLVIGVDHAALGFGSICAHGHADALSIQIYLNGNPVLVDPGTYIYHCELISRNAFRETRNHNTVCIEGKNQSEMLGAFLWGNKAKAVLEDFIESDGCVTLVMTQDGYRPVIHRRTVNFDGFRTVIITDELTAEADAEANFLFGPEMRIIWVEDAILIGEIAKMSFSVPLYELTQKEYSSEYGRKVPVEGIKVLFKKELVTKIQFE